MNVYSGLVVIVGTRGMLRVAKCADSYIYAFCGLADTKFSYLGCSYLFDYTYLVGEVKHEGIVYLYSEPRTLIPPHHDKR